MMHSALYLMQILSVRGGILNNIQVGTSIALKCDGRIYRVRFFGLPLTA